MSSPVSTLTYSRHGKSFIALSNRRNRSYDVTMVDSVLRLRHAAWHLVIGMIAGGTVALFAGAGLFWALVALALAALLIAQFITFQEPIRPAEEKAADPVAALPPMTRVLLDQLPIPVMLLDDDERVLFVNYSMRDVLGPGLDRKRASSVLRNPDVLAAIGEARRGFSTNVPFSLPVPIERHFQAYVARTSVTPPVTAVLLHDLTVVRRSEQMRADFIANVSHELRTPLAAVSGFIETLRGHARQDEVAREQFLDIMSVEAARMRRLIEDLLSLTRIEMNEHVKPEGRIGLDGVVRQAAAALKPLAAQDGIIVIVESQPGLPQVVGDHDELVQLFQNLIHNAIKYGRDHGRVEVTLSRQDALVAVAVRDDGEGIAPNAIPRLTERFYRVDVKRSRERGGTGLGLAIVKHIVNRHQGRLSIESKLGVGSTFTVLLPAAPAEAPPKIAQAEPVTEML
jgi:two-component system, OmpR family, phosphate regulon sensor histidine kinase PhoR